MDFTRLKSKNRQGCAYFWSLSERIHFLPWLLEGGSFLAIENDPYSLFKFSSLTLIICPTLRRTCVITLSPSTYSKIIAPSQNHKCKHICIVPFDMWDNILKHSEDIDIFGESLCCLPHLLWKMHAMLSKTKVTWSMLLWNVKARVNSKYWKYVYN